VDQSISQVYGSSNVTEQASPDGSGAGSSPKFSWLKLPRVNIKFVAIGVLLLASLYAGGLYIGSLKNVYEKQSRLAQLSVELTTEYNNPFVASNQYVDPFDEFKSPFNSLK